MSNIWSIDLSEQEFELGGKGVIAATLTRSISSRMKFVVATESKLYVLGSKEGKIEATYDYSDALLDVKDSSQLKLIAVQQGFALIDNNMIKLRKLQSSGKIEEERFETCETITPLVDAVYDVKQPT